MSYFDWDDAPPTPLDLHHELCSAVQAMDVARVKKLLADGARPLPHQSPNPLAVPSTGLPAARQSPHREHVLDLILETLDPVRDRVLVEQAFAQVLDMGDRPVLQKLEPLLPAGFYDYPAGKNLVIKALEMLRDAGAGYRGFMDGSERFEWLMDRGIDLSPWLALEADSRSEPLHFALERFSAQSTAPINRQIYAKAIDRLVQDKAPLWTHHPKKSLRAGRHIMASENPTWLTYLVQQFPPEKLSELNEGPGSARAKALLVKHRMQKDLAKAPAAPRLPRPTRF